MNINTNTLLNTQPSIKASDFVNKNDKELKKRTDQFEAIFIKNMLDIAMKPKTGILPKGVGSDIYKSMYTQSLADKMSGTLGLSQMLYNHLKENK